MSACRIRLKKPNVRRSTPVAGFAVPAVGDVAPAPRISCGVISTGAVAPGGVAH
jgi:hypothetical protein